MTKRKPYAIKLRNIRSVSGAYQSNFLWLLSIRSRIQQASFLLLGLGISWQNQSNSLVCVTTFLDDWNISCLWLLSIRSRVQPASVLFTRFGPKGNINVFVLPECRLSEYLSNKTLYQAFSRQANGLTLNISVFQGLDLLEKKNRKAKKICVVVDLFDKAVIQEAR